MIYDISDVAPQMTLATPVRIASRMLRNTTDTAMNNAIPIWNLSRLARLPETWRSPTLENAADRRYVPLTQRSPQVSVWETPSSTVEQPRVYPRPLASSSSGTGFV